MMRRRFHPGRYRHAKALGALRKAAVRSLVLCAVVLAGCGEEDRSQAEAGAAWLAERRLFRPFGEVGEVTKVAVESAKLIRMEVTVANRRHVEAIDAQSLMVQSLIARDACPSEKSAFWPILGDKVALRVDLTAGGDVIASGICRKP